MAKRPYLVLDVFTRDRLAGNPLAVVLESGGLDTAAMQKIANEFNLSETVFVTEKDAKGDRAAIRIFTPHYEMPFAGHPTVGSAVALAYRQGMAQARAFVLDEKIGPVACSVSEVDGAGFAEFELTRLSEPLPMAFGAGQAAEALGLREDEIGFDGHRLSHWSAGVGYVMVPVNSLDVLRGARLDTQIWTKQFGGESGERISAAYVYVRGANGVDFQARMFAGHLGLTEDPATGSAAAAFTGAVVAAEGIVSGEHRFRIAQGVEMGRPSDIRVRIAVENGRAVRAFIGGFAVTVAEGILFA
ncbi:MAG: PhzF family phenazine biosynthesis protein [Methylobacterium mesophilicum]|nr:PhzF family phenazine biosynthesis protein [Methylobacterium mesophilicum]